MEEKKEMEHNKTITLSRGCSKPSAIDTESKGSGQRIEDANSTSESEEVTDAQ
jgi:hypothetical protein